MSNLLLFLRSTLFNIAFYGITAVMCVACLPALFLSRAQAMKLVHFYCGVVYWLERHIAGLDFEIRGREYLPASGPYVIAAKHQSPYETFKLHLLFGDPAIVLKRELLKIPLWGRFLAKIDPIAIDRKRGRTAITQIIDGARHVQGQGRPIVIFPQGTRVLPSQTVEEKPYKTGIARIYEETGMPVIPMALNSGMFWPRHSWIKKPGTVVFEFLPPVPQKLGIYEVMKDLQGRLEPASEALAREAGLPRQ